MDNHDSTRISICDEGVEAGRNPAEAGSIGRSRAIVHPLFARGFDRCFEFDRLSRFALLLEPVGGK
jgi:hypothetical protein